MSQIDDLIAAEAAKLGDKAKVSENDDVRNAKIAAAERMAKRLGAIVQENPGMSVLTFGSLWKGALADAGHRALAKEFIVALNLLNVKPVSPNKVVLKAEAKPASAVEAAPQAVPAKRGKK